MQPLQHHHLLHWVAVAAITAITLPATAQDGAKPDAQKVDTLPEVVVSIQDENRRVPLQTPASVSVIDGTEIEKGRIEHMGDVALRTPNVYLTDMTRTAPQLTIRGHGFADDESDSVSNPVLIDGVQVYPAAIGQLFDVERIEIRRGPQLAGPGGSGGQASVQTRDPGFEFGGSMQLDYGTGNRMRAATGLDVPLSDSTAVRIAAGYEKADGYIDNLTLDRDDTAGWNSRFARLKLLHRDGGRGEWRIGLLHVDTNAGNDYFLKPELADRHESVNTESGRTDTRYTMATGEYRGNLASGTELLVRLGGYDAEWNFWMPASVYGMKSGQDIKSKGFSAEAQLSGKADLWDWSLGAYAAHMDRDAPYLMDMSPYFLYDQQSTVRGNTAALFGEVGWRFAPGWRLVGGLRYEYARRKLDWSFADLSSSAGVQASLSKQVLLPRLRLEFESSRTDLAQFGWLSLARGYKAPGFNHFSNHIDSVRQPYKAETGHYLELGWRWQQPQGLWQLEASVFQTWLRNQQADELANGGGSRTANARRSHSRGVEISASLRPVKTVELGGFIGWLDAAYDDYLDPFDGVDYSGQQWPNTARQSYGLSLRWAPTANWEVAIQASRKSSSRLYPNNLQNAAFTLVDASLSYRQGDWTLGIYGKNLLDEAYYTRSLGASGVTTGAPRTLGVRVAYDF